MIFKENTMYSGKRAVDQGSEGTASEESESRSWSETIKCSTTQSAAGALLSILVWFFINFFMYEAQVVVRKKTF